MVCCSPDSKGAGSTEHGVVVVPHPHRRLRSRWRVASQVSRLLALSISVVTLHLESSPGLETTVACIVQRPAAGFTPSTKPPFVESRSYHRLFYLITYRIMVFLLWISDQFYSCLLNFLYLLLCLRDSNANFHCNIGLNRWFSHQELLSSVKERSLS